MKINIDRILLLVVPVLFVVSAAYYQGYWVPFGIDIYSYLDASDIIKGVGRPAFETVIAAIVFALIDHVSSFIKSVREDVKNRLVRVLLHDYFVSWLLMILAITFLLDFSIKYMAIYFVCTIVSMFVAAVYDEINNISSGDISTSLSRTVVFGLLFWPSIIFFKGRASAENILSNDKFDYSELYLKSDSTNLKPFKFLGKAGAYYLFISPDNKEKAIIALDKIPELHLVAFDKSDKKSVATYKLSISRPKSKNVTPVKVSPDK